MVISNDDTDRAGRKGEAARPSEATDVQAAVRRRAAKSDPSEWENSLRPSNRRRRSALGPAAERPAEPATPVGASPDPGTRVPPSLTPRDGQAEVDPWTVPQSVRDRFVQDGHRFHFPDGAPAFKDRGRKLTTPSENTEVVHSLIQIAESRGWGEITVSGTERFRQEAWRQARLAGLSVRGYRPSDLERGQLIRALVRQSESPREASAGGPVPPKEGARAPSDAAAQAAATPAKRPVKDERIVGKLVDHGRDTYRFDPHEEMSYFVRLETPEGKRTIWGKDLERAFAQSLTQPRMGEEVALVPQGKDAVKVKRRERDDEGRVLQEKELAVHRNRWVIEKREFFEARAAAAAVLRDPRVEPRDAVRRHPQLAGTYLNLRAAEIAARNLRDPQDQRRFVETVRAAFAKSIERGEPLQPVRLRERTATREREQDLARG